MFHLGIETRRRSVFTSSRANARQPKPGRRASSITHWRGTQSSEITRTRAYPWSLGMGTGEGGRGDRRTRDGKAIRRGKAGAVEKSHADRKPNNLFSRFLALGSSFLPFLVSLFSLPLARFLVLGMRLCVRCCGCCALACRYLYRHSTWRRNRTGNILRGLPTISQLDGRRASYSG